jgi:crotonobetaine/carnitine-CoA ligase
VPSDSVWRKGVEQHTITALLDARLEDNPDGEYLDRCGTKFSAADVEENASRIANGLSALGLQRGDRVATLIENSPEALLAWWGTVVGGRVAVPINTAYKGQYLRHQLADSGARVVFVQADLAERVEAVRKQLPDLDRIIVVESDEWRALLESREGRPAAEVSPSDLATFVYTGGTTGLSKGCMLSHNYHVSLARQIGTCWQTTADDVIWTPLPMYHYNALVTAVLGALLTGGRGAIERRFSVSNFWPEMNRVGATVTSTLGSMAYLLVNDDDRPEMPRSGAPEANTTLRLVGAAPLPAEIDERLRERFGVDTFSGGFGLTEASLLSWQPPGVRNKPNAAGVINDEYFDVRIFGDGDEELERGNDGEIVVRPKQPNVMFEGYWGRPDATVAAGGNWWFHTGDIGRIDDDGFLYFVDRKADYLRRRGENISSYEVESVLLKHGALVDAAVHAVPSDMTEDDLKITATVKEDVAVTEEELFRWCIDQLPYFALPRYIEFRDELPRSPVGRVLKRTLRDEGVTPSTWDADAAGITYEKR